MNLSPKTTPLARPLFLDLGHSLSWGSAACHQAVHTCDADIQVWRIHAVKVKVEPGLAIDFGRVQSLSADAHRTAVYHVHVVGSTW